jgi:ubiquitin-protein ligase
MIYHRIGNKSNTTGATCGEGTIYHIGVHEFILFLSVPSDYPFVALTLRSVAALLVAIPYQGIGDRNHKLIKLSYIRSLFSNYHIGVHEFILFLSVPSDYPFVAFKPTIMLSFFPT